MLLPNVIYVMGPPGAGKGSQARLLAEKLGFRQFSTGNAFRTVAASDTDLGRRVKERIDNGYLAPPEMAAEIVIHAVRDSLQKNEGLVFDGTPRTGTEAALVDRFFVEHGYGQPLAMLIVVERTEVERRNSQRQFCFGLQGTEEDFPVYTMNDRRRCEALGGHVERRPDDDPAKFATRWDEFQKQTWPVIEHYRQVGILREVDGMGTIQEVHERVMNVVQSIIRKP